MACCCCCFEHYTQVKAPVIGTELIESHNATNFKISGDSFPLVEITVPPQHAMVGEPGSFVYFNQGVSMKSKYDDGAYVNEPGCCATCCNSCKRCCSGESMALAHFTNESNQEKAIAFGSSVPGQIVPVNLKSVPDNVLFTMNGSFLMGAKGTRVDTVRADCKQCCFGSGLCFQKIDGNGMVFLNAGGSVTRQDINDETHRIDPSSLVAFTKGLEVSVQKAGSCLTMCCGGEGVSLTVIKGTGTYWVCSSPWSEQLRYALQFLPPKKA